MALAPEWDTNNADAVYGWDEDAFYEGAGDEDVEDDGFYDEDEELF